MNQQFDNIKENTTTLKGGSAIYALNSNIRIERALFKDLQISDHLSNF